jgi:hypothetical protein
MHQREDRIEAKELGAVAADLALWATWPTTLEALMEAERAAVRERFPGISEEDVRRLVDDRYRELLV